MSTISTGPQSTVIPTRVMSAVPMLIIACIASLTLGIGTGGMGTVLNDLSLHTGSPLEDVGILFTMIFSASLVSQLIAGTVNDRFGARPIVLFGGFAYGTGIILCSLVPSLTLLRWTGLLAGAGFGTLAIGMTLMLTETFPAHRLRFTSLTNVFFGLGAVIGPLLGGISLRLIGSALPLMWLSGSIALGILFTVTIMREMDTRPPASVHQTDTFVPFSLPVGRFAALALYRSPILWMCSAMILVYGGLENGIGGWSPVYLERSTALPAENAALVVSAFYLMLTVGRIINTVIGTRYTARSILMAACTGSLISAVLLLIGYGSLPLTIIASLLLGLSLGPIFPTMFALATGTFRAAPGKAGSLVGAMGSLGASLLPPLQGFVLERSGVAANPVYLLATIVVMFGFFLVASQLLTRKQKPAQDVVTRN